MLKPALARGELRCIGAKTVDEYRKYIEKDAALERRFQPVLVKEPSAKNSMEPAAWLPAPKSRLIPVIVAMKPRLSDAKPIMSVTPY